MTKNPFSSWSVLLIFGFVLQSAANAGTITSDFVTYLKRFSHEASIRGVRFDDDRANRTSIRFSFDLHDFNHLAECNSDTLQVSVSESYWLTASDLQREELIFHELGHCILGRGHEDGVMPISGGAIYKSLMNSFGDALMRRFPISSNCLNNTEDCGTDLIFAPKSKNNFYAKYHKIYMDELFGVVAPNVVSTVKKTSVRASNAKTPTENEVAVKPQPITSPEPIAPSVKLKKGMKKVDVIAAIGQPAKVESEIRMPHVGFWGTKGTIFQYQGAICNADYFKVPECNLDCYSHWEGIHSGQCVVAFDGDEIVYIYNFKPQYIDF